MKAVGWCVGFITAHSCDMGEAVCRAAFNTETAGWGVKLEQVLERERPVL